MPIICLNGKFFRSVGFLRELLDEPLDELLEPFDELPSRASVGTTDGDGSRGEGGGAIIATREDATRFISFKSSRFKSEEGPTPYLPEPCEPREPRDDVARDEPLLRLSADA